MDDSFISFLFNQINSVISIFVKNTYQNLISENTGVITAVFTLYVIILGYRYFFDESYSASLSSITRHLFAVLIVYSLILSWDIYNKVLYNVFTNEPEFISVVVINSSAQHLPGDSVLQALDSIWQRGMDIATTLWAEGSMNNFAFYFYAFIDFVITLVLCGLALGIFIYAKLGMAIMLAVGVIFIIFSLFDSTRGFTQSWIQNLMTFSFIPVIASAIMSLMFFLIDQTLGKIPTDDPQHAFSHLAEYCLVGIGAIILLWKVDSISSSLGGGVTLGGMHHAKKAFSDLASASGLKTAANAAGSAGKKAYGAAKGYFSKGDSKESSNNKKSKQISSARAQNRKETLSKDD